MDDKDFNWDDYNNDDNSDDERDLFGTHRLQHEIEKGMFLQDAESGHPLVLDPKEYKELFGKVTRDDMYFLTQSFFSQYHRLGMSIDTLFDTWGSDWIFEVLKFCETTEEYELCAIIKGMWEDRDSLKGWEHLIKGSE